MVTKNAIIRVARNSDAREIREIYKPNILGTSITFEEHVPEVAEFENRIKNVLKDCPYLVCEINNEIAGYAYASEHRSRAAYRWNKEVSVYVSPKFQRRNIARALYISLFPILKKQGFTNLLAGITIPNEASIALHESFGFTKCAEYKHIGFKLGKWHTVGWWELWLTEDTDMLPQEPIPFRNFMKNNEISAFLEKGMELLKF